MCSGEYKTFSKPVLPLITYVLNSEKTNKRKFKKTYLRYNICNNCDYKVEVKYL